MKKLRIFLLSILLFSCFPLWAQIELPDMPLSEYLEEKLSLDLLVIDDFGLMELDLDKCRDLFEVIDGSDGRRSTIIISQVPIAKWYDMFSNATYAEACLSRITDKKHAYRLEMNGRSMRG